MYGPGRGEEGRGPRGKEIGEGAGGAGRVGKEEKKYASCVEADILGVHMKY